MLKSVAGLLLISTLASAFQVPSDCLVSERIVENEILFDTVEFLALVPETGIIQARIICHDKTERYLEWNSQKVSTPTTSTKSPPDTGGWTRFALGLIGKLSLSDDRNQTWVSLDLPHDECVVSSVELKGSKFTHKCSAGSPVWKVSDEAVTIPLRLNGKTSETISLFSLTPFSPVLGIGGSETHLRMNGDQMVANGDYYNPLSAVTNYRLEFGVSEESGSTVFQAFLLDESKTSIYTLSLPGVPKEMHVRSKDKTKFVLVQYLNREKELNSICNCTDAHYNTGLPNNVPPETPSCTCNKVCQNSDGKDTAESYTVNDSSIANQDCPKKQGIFIGIIAILGLVSLVVTAVLFFQRRSCYCVKTTKRPGPRGLPRNRKPSPGDAEYLEPTPIQPPQVRPPREFLPSPTARISSTLSEHLYEEVDDIVPHHYENTHKRSFSIDVPISPGM